MTNDLATPPKAGKKEWTGLAVLALPTLLLSLDMSVLFLALPELSADLGADSTEQLWIMDIYGFLIAGFLITMGALGDRIGRRRLLLCGGAVFAVASVVAAYSTSTEMLIATRALMGIAGATLMPSTLALISNMFRDPTQRGVAIAAWMTCFMGGMTIGPIIGGVLLQSFWWGSAFLLAVPMMLLLAIAGPMLLPEYKDPRPGRLDPTSVVLSLLAILPTIYGIKEIAKHGLEMTPVIAIVIGSWMGITFVRRQLTLTSPLLDMSLFRNARFSTALAVMSLTGLIMGGTFLLVSQSLQLVSGLSPLRAGLALLPQAVVMAAASMAAPWIARRVDPKKIIVGGLVVSAIGFACLTKIGADDGLVTLITVFGVIALGVGGTGPLLSDMIVGSVAPEKAGSAASVQETSGEFGIAVGMAVVGSVATLIYRGRLTVDSLPGVPAQAIESARESIAAAVVVGGPVVDPARDAFMDGLNAAGVLGVCVCIGLAVVARKTLPERARSEVARHESSKVQAPVVSTAK